MIRRLTIIVFAFFLFQIVLLFSCTNCGPFPNRYKLSSATLTVCKANYDEALDFLFTSVEIPNQSVLYSEFGLMLHLKHKEYFSYLRKNNLFTTGLLYACSPSMPVTIETVDSITITSDQPFSSHMAGGTNLVSVFDVVVTNDYAGIYFEKHDLQEYIDSKPSAPTELVFTLKMAPDNTNIHRFTIHYYQKGVSIDCVELQTENIEIVV